MGEILLIIIAVILATSGDFTFFWIFAGLIALVLIGSLFGAGSGSARQERPRTRIRIPGYIHPDYFRCSVCGSGFGADTMTCPHCGVRFNHTKTDERAFIEK